MNEKKVAWGKVVEAFIKCGWSPPTPSEAIWHRIIDDIEDVSTGHGFAVPTLELAPAQILVLRLAAEGYSVEESAECLNISPSTIKSQLKRVRERLGARNTAHAVAMAIRQGIIDTTNQEEIEVKAA